MIKIVPAIKAKKFKTTCIGPSISLAKHSISASRPRALAGQLPVLKSVLT